MGVGMRYREWGQQPRREDQLQRFPGSIANSDQDFVQRVTDLYVSECAWKQACQKTRLSSEKEDASTATESWHVRMDTQAMWPHVVDNLIVTMNSLRERRRRDTLRGILWREGLRSTEYFARYIEQKENLLQR